MKYGFGVDVGGTTVKLGLLSEAGELLEKWELPTRTENGGENILPDIARSVQDCMVRRGLSRDDCLGLGIGEQQMLAIARGLMSDPSMVMLDEPSLGLAPVIVDDVFDVIHNINTVKKLPVILVEQNAYMALSISNRCYVLENGRIAHSGKSSELIQSDVIRETYLGD